jgi:hypothetical protein
MHFISNVTHTFHLAHYIYISDHILPYISASTDIMQYTRARAHTHIHTHLVAHNKIQVEYQEALGRQAGRNKK